jgi:asparagine synthase (glutamine-hydrolysing)
MTGRFLLVVPHEVAAASSLAVDLPHAHVIDLDRPAIVSEARLDARADTITALSLPGGADDSTIVAAAWERWGSALTDHLLGDFAVAAWRPDRGELFLARDHVGVTPLHYARFRDGVAASPDLGALLELPGVDRRPHEGRIAEVLIDWWHDHEASFYQGIRRVPDGHRAWVTPAGRVRVERYWQIPTEELRLDGDAAYEEAFRDLFERAVSDRLPPGGDVGLELSGGIDSSTVAGLSADRLAPHGRAAIGIASSFADPAYEGGVHDEGRFRAWFADRPGARLLEVPAASALSPAAVDASIAANHGPIGGAMILVRQRLFQVAASMGALVVLDGQDGDTSIGYGHERLQWLFSRGHMATWTRELRHIQRRVGWKRAVRAAVAYSVLSPATWAAWQLGRKPRGLRESLASSALLDSTRTWQRVKRVGIAPPGDVRRSHLVNVRAAYNSFALEATDALGRASGIASRHPYYDARIIEFAVRLPPDQLLRNGISRSIQRRALLGLAPTEVLSRTDKGQLPGGFISHALQAAGIDEVVAEAGGAAAPYIDVTRMTETYERWRRTGDVGPAYQLYPVTLLHRWLSNEGPSGSIEVRR